MVRRTRVRISVTTFSNFISRMAVLLTTGKTNGRKLTIVALRSHAVAGRIRHDAMVVMVLFVGLVLMILHPCD